MRGNDHVTEDVSLMDGERLCQRWTEKGYVRGGQFNGGRTSGYGGGQFKEGRMVDIEVENDFVTKAACLMEGE